MSTRTHFSAVRSACPKIASRRCVRLPGGEETRRRGRYGFSAQRVLLGNSTINHVKTFRTDGINSVAPVRTATPDAPREP